MNVIRSGATGETSLHSLPLVRESPARCSCHARHSRCMTSKVSRAVGPLLGVSTPSGRLVLRSAAARAALAAAPSLRSRRPGPPFITGQLRLPGGRANTKPGQLPAAVASPPRALGSARRVPLALRDSGLRSSLSAAARRPSPLRQARLPLPCCPAAESRRRLRAAPLPVWVPAEGGGWGAACGPRLFSSRRSPSGELRPFGALGLCGVCQANAGLKPVAPSGLCLQKKMNSARKMGAPNWAL